MEIRADTQEFLFTFHHTIEALRLAIKRLVDSITTKNWNLYLSMFALKLLP